MSSNVEEPVGRTDGSRYRRLGGFAHKTDETKGHEKDQFGGVNPAACPEIVEGSACAQCWAATLVYNNKIGTSLCGTPIAHEHDACRKG